MFRSFFSRRREKDWTLRDLMFSMFVTGLAAGGSCGMAALGFKKIGVTVGFLAFASEMPMQYGLALLMGGSFLVALINITGGRLVRHAEARYRLTELDQSNPGPDPVG